MWWRGWSPTRASYVNGATIVVDGGETAGIRALQEDGP